MIPLLSVVVANYNHGESLGECLESILSQTMKDLEIMVFDDGSTDGSVALIREWQRREPERIQLICGGKRRGPAYARHQAIQKARGKYLTTLDADDTFYDPGKLSREMDLIEKTFKAKGIEAAAFSDVIEEQENGTIRKWSESLPVRQGWIMDSILTRDGLIPHNYVFPRCMYDRIGGYDLRLRTHEDWDLKIRLAEILPFYFTGAPGIVYRRHEGGLSRIRHHVRMCNLWRVFRRNIHRLPGERRESARRIFSQLMKKREESRARDRKNGGFAGKMKHTGIIVAARWRCIFCGRINALRSARKLAIKK